MKLAHWLAFGDLLEEKIKADVPGFTKVADAADLAGVKNSAQVVPACYVVYAGHVPGPMLRGSKHVSWDQTWLTVVVTRSAQEAKSGGGARRLAGPFCGALIKAISGWTAADYVQPAEPIAPPAKPLLITAGTLYVPLAWRVRIQGFDAGG